MGEYEKVTFDVSIMYRHVHLLSTLCNEIQQTMIMTPLIAAVIMISAFSLATLAHIPFRAENVAIICVLLATYVDYTLAMLFAFGGMVTVQKKSKLFIQQLKSHRYHGSSEMERLWVHKFMKFM